MVTYLYCLFRDRVDPPGGLTGVAGSPVRSLDAGPLRAWVETTPAAPAVSPEALRLHDAVTSAGLDVGSTPIPVRFGDVFESDQACLDSLVARSGELMAALARVAGRVEMTVAIRLDPPAPDAAGQPIDPGNASPGRAYLERLREERHQTQILRQQGHVLARPVLSAVHHLVADERAALRPSPPTYLVSHLIPRDAADEYRRLALAAIGARSGTGPLRAVVRGPSAPFSFTTVSA